MILGKVVGSVWGSKQSPTLVGKKVVKVRPLRVGAAPAGASFTADTCESWLEESEILAVDVIGADVGELVLVSIGSRVRDLVVGASVPTKNCVIAIVDQAWMASGEELGR